MKKLLLSFAMVIVIAAATSLSGCGHHKYRHVSSIAPVGTINVVFQGDFPSEDKEQIQETITTVNNFFSQEVTNKFDVTVVVVDTPVKECTNDCTHFSGPNHVVIHCGEFNELPDLYEHLCHAHRDPDFQHKKKHWKGWRHRGHKVSCDIAKKRGRKHCSHDD